MCNTVSNHYRIFRKIENVKCESGNNERISGAEANLVYTFLKHTLNGVLIFKPWCLFFLASVGCFIYNDVWLGLSDSYFYGILIFIFWGKLGHIIQTESMSAVSRGMWFVPFMLASVFFFDCVHKNSSLLTAVVCYLVPLSIGIKGWLMPCLSLRDSGHDFRWRQGRDIELLGGYMRSCSSADSELFVAGSIPELYVVSGLKAHTRESFFLRSIDFFSSLNDNCFVFNEFLFKSCPTFIVCNRAVGFDIDHDYLKSKYGLEYNPVTTLNLDCDHLRLYELKEQTKSLPNEHLGKTEVLNIIVPANTRFSTQTEEGIAHKCSDWQRRLSHGAKAAIYGGGAHTDGLLHMCSEVLNVDTVKAVIDKAPAKEEVNDIAMVKADLFDYDSVDFIIISSNAYEQEIYDFLIKKVDKDRIERIYG